MSQRLRFVMIGGFLGAGKTTTIARLARMYQERGLKVGIVTNDQAADLVDTLNLRAQGFHVGEVAGACFCCSFDDLTDTVAALAEEDRPDLILAEPVGSCTDLVATVIRPLEHLYGDRFDVAPYGVILKPSHGRRILGNESGAGFSPKAAYIFKKQLEEADFVILNRIDQLSPSEVEELMTLLESEQPQLLVIKTSALSGEGFDALTEMLDRQGQFGQKRVELDYDVYAEGEAELGWLNSSLRVTADNAYSLDDLLLSVVEHLRISLAEIQAEAAHLKAIGLWEGFYGVANLVSSDTPAQLSLPADCQTKTADLVINARVATAPELLKLHVEQAIAKACNEMDAKADFRKTSSFRPGRPVPTHRIT